MNREERRAQLRQLIERSADADGLEAMVRELRQSGVSSDELYQDLMSIWGPYSDADDEAKADVIADVMDLLVGWCAPSARIS